MDIKLYTIGFGKKSAEEFFTILKKHKIERLIDVRESNSNIYAGFTIKKNLPFFLNTILEVEYLELKLLAPTKELRVEYHSSNKSDWNKYKEGYIKLLDSRKITDTIDVSIFHNAILLCSEPTADKCHRRLAAEYLKKIDDKIQITHL